MTTKCRPFGFLNGMRRESSDHCVRSNELVFLLSEQERKRSRYNFIITYLWLILSMSYNIRNVASAFCNLFSFRVGISCFFFFPVARHLLEMVKFSNFVRMPPNFGGFPQNTLNFINSTKHL